MIRVLITGAGSYIGTNIASELLKEPELFEVQEMDVRNGLDEQAFQGFDAVLHVAGIAHQRETEENFTVQNGFQKLIAAVSQRQPRSGGERCPCSQKDGCKAVCVFLQYERLWHDYRTHS